MNGLKWTTLATLLITSICANAQKLTEEQIRVVLAPQKGQPIAVFQEYQTPCADRGGWSDCAIFYKNKYYIRQNKERLTRSELEAAGIQEELDSTRIDEPQYKAAWRANPGTPNPAPFKATVPLTPWWPLIEKRYRPGWRELTNAELVANWLKETIVGKE